LRGCPTLRARIALAAVISLLATAVHADCVPDPKWLPVTPSLDFDQPPPHPASDCGFYQPAWQLFLFITQPDNSGQLAFFSYKGISDIFGQGAHSKFSVKKPGVLSLAPRTIQASNDPASGLLTSATAAHSPLVNAGARQAGLGGLLVDQSGQPVF
jgi:hypothetical protein